MKKTKLRIFSFFSGSGFLDLGFEDNGFDIEFVNEYHPAFMLNSDFNDIGAIRI